MWDVAGYATRYNKTNKQNKQSMTGKQISDNYSYLAYFQIKR